MLAVRSNHCRNCRRRRRRRRRQRCRQRRRRRRGACLCCCCACLPAHALTALLWTARRNIFDCHNAKGEPTGEAGTLASAASPKANPLLIYAGGQNNGVSSGVIKSVDGGKHWTRQSVGLWDTRILGVWVHPDDPQGSHVFAGTHSGIYESKDSAATWTFAKETATWGNVMSFRQGVISGTDYIFANGEGDAAADAPRADAPGAAVVPGAAPGAAPADVSPAGGTGFIATKPLKDGVWQKVKAPGGIAPNAYLSVVTTAGKSEILTCIGGWGGGKLYYGAVDTPSKITWDGPMMLPTVTLKTWVDYPAETAITGSAITGKQPDVHKLGTFTTLETCKAAINASYGSVLLLFT